MVLWICETLPLPATASLGAVLAVALGVVPAMGEAFAARLGASLLWGFTFTTIGNR